MPLGELAPEGVVKFNAQTFVHAVQLLDEPPDALLAQLQPVLGTQLELDMLVCLTLEQLLD